MFQSNEQLLIDLVDLQEEISSIAVHLIHVPAQREILKNSLLGTQKR